MYSAQSNHPSEGYLPCHPSEGWDPEILKQHFSLDASLRWHDNNRNLR